MTVLEKEFYETMIRTMKSVSEELKKTNKLLEELSKKDNKEQDNE